MLQVIVRDKKQLINAIKLNANQIVVTDYYVYELATRLWGESWASRIVNKRVYINQAVNSSKFQYIDTRYSLGRNNESYLEGIFETGIGGFILKRKLKDYRIFEVRNNIIKLVRDRERSI